MNDVMKREETGIDAVKSRMAAIGALMKATMRDGVHYGVIPGTDKPTLLKPGAEQILINFNWGCKYEIQITADGEHRDYTVTARLFARGSELEVGEGVGMCSTREKKYSKRKVFNDGVFAGWEDNKDIADTYNTVLKMAKKRALVDATLSTGACSDLFTQDIEDMDLPMHSSNAGKKSYSKPMGGYQKASNGSYAYEVKGNPKEIIPIKDQLKAAGYRWNAEGKSWVGNQVVEIARAWTYKDGVLIDNLGSEHPEDDLPPMPAYTGEASYVDEDDNIPY